MRTIEEADVAHNVPVEITKMIAHFLHTGIFFGSSAGSRATAKGSLLARREVGASTLAFESSFDDMSVREPLSRSLSFGCFSVCPAENVCEVFAESDMKARPATAYAIFEY